MRTQPTELKTGKKQKLLILLTCVFMVITALVLLIAKLTPDPYQPPEFDPAAVEGTPTPDKSFAYDEISVENGYSFYVAGSIYQQEDGSVCIYLTNPQGSDYVLQCEIFDEEGNVLYRSGAIKPGCYVERIRPVEKIENEAMKVDMKIYAFEQDTWYSRGTISLTNTLQPW